VPRNHDQDPGPGKISGEEMLDQFQAAISGLGPVELRDLLQTLTATAMPVECLLERPAPSSRRRPRRADVVTYRVRVDLMETAPPVWRRLELSSDLFLGDLHQVIQVAFGWTDSHLHQFGSGPAYYSPDTEYYLEPFAMAEGEVGVPESEVRLDEVLVDEGDELFYCYDFGDDWQHTVTLEAVLPRRDSAPLAVCTAGDRPGPAEDCGGAHCYELIAAANDPTHPNHAKVRAEFVRVFGDDVDPATFAVTPFVIDEINRALGFRIKVARAALPEPIAGLVDSVQFVGQRQLLLRMIGEARLDEPVAIDADTAAKMVYQYSWLLDRVGAEGIRLTAAGYLPPAHVEAAVAELGLADEWVGSGNRENQTLPVLSLRESAQKMGLLRKQRGSLLLTPRGRGTRTDPIALWHHIAEKLPLRSTDPCELQAALILLVVIASETPGDPYATVADLLGAIGWTVSDGSPLTPSMAATAAWHTASVLRRLGALAGDRFGGHERPTPDGVTFARAALKTFGDG